MTKHILIISLFTVLYTSQAVAMLQDVTIDIRTEDHRQKSLKVNIHKTVFSNAIMSADKNTIAKYLLVEEIIKKFGYDATLPKRIWQSIKEGQVIKAMLWTGNIIEQSSDNNTRTHGLREDTHCAFTSNNLNAIKIVNGKINWEYESKRPHVNVPHVNTFAKKSNFDEPANIELCLPPLEMRVEKLNIYNIRPIYL